MNNAVRPAEQAAIVVLNETLPMPCASSADSVLPGLNPYHPNQKISPPVAPMIKSCGFIGAPPSRLNTRPSRGPSAIAPASEITPPMVWTTVEPAKSWNEIGAITASHPSGPHAQCPMIG